ncbi:Tfo1 transposase [Fusarium pseudocircinatum]|uniref:Tfo1 transposase n=1 Tax=Fusarium pseudocircinatum TaxID=56676 RepID=A0A8H5LF37_9HYPO|nr:Tfo1 transposase [Fusarium pseudocircinatum]
MLGYHTGDNATSNDTLLKELSLSLNLEFGDTLKRTETFLSMFTSGTLWVKGSEASLSQALTLMYAILTFFKDQKELYKSGLDKDLRMARSIGMGWFILEKYYALVESTPVYTAAMLLDPSKRKHYLL